ncbi:MAG: M56 family metallopeptidase [Acetatifactor sp.]|nr:M56 family metallopeptidase [Acetatifactor sp.]
MAILFYFVLNMSIMASVTGCIVLILRRIRLLPRRMVVLFWMIPFFRAILPIGMNSSVSFMNIVFGWIGKTVPLIEINDRVKFSFDNYMMLAQKYEPFQFVSSKTEHIFLVASICWLTVALFIMVLFCASYFMGKKDAAEAEHWKDDIWFSKNAQGIAVYGIFKPRIVFPISYEGKDLEMILQHERSHVKRKDNLWRLLGIGIVAVHWYNPLMWLFLKTFLVDLEMACDETVISKYDEEKRKQYALTLLECKGNNDLLISAFGGANLNARIKFIVSYKKMLKISLFGLAAIVIFIFYALLTNA